MNGLRLASGPLLYTQTFTFIVLRINFYKSKKNNCSFFNSVSILLHIEPLKLEVWVFKFKFFTIRWVFKFKFSTFRCKIDGHASRGRDEKCFQAAGCAWNAHHSGYYCSLNVTDGRFDGTGSLACLSPFSVMMWIRSNYLFQSEACFSYLHANMINTMLYPINFNSYTIKFTIPTSCYFV